MSILKAKMFESKSVKLTNNHILQTVESKEKVLFQHILNKVSLRMIAFSCKRFFLTAVAWKLNLVLLFY